MVNEKWFFIQACERAGTNESIATGLKSEASKAHSLWITLLKIELMVSRSALGNFYTYHVKNYSLEKCK